MAGVTAVLVAAGVLSAIAWAGSGSAASPAKTTTGKTSTAKKPPVKKKRPPATSTGHGGTTTSKTTTTTGAKPSPILAADACTKVVGPEIQALTGTAVTLHPVPPVGAPVVLKCQFDVGGAFAFFVQVTTLENVVTWTKNLFDQLTTGAHGKAAICHVTVRDLTYPSDVQYTPPRVVPGLGDYGFVNDPCPTHYAEETPLVFAAAAGRSIRVQFNTDVVASLTTAEQVALTRWVIAQLPAS